MIAESRVVGIGAAYVEGKFRSQSLQFPEQRNQLPEFLDNHPEADLYVGGAIPNILTAFARISGNPNVRLLSCVGNDTRGMFFIEQISGLLGQPTVSPKKPTGVFVARYDKGLVKCFSFPGAGMDLKIPEEELSSQTNQLVITGVDFCSTPETVAQVNRMLATIKDGDSFVLNLVGANYYENLDEILASISRPPSLVFGNASELRAVAKGSVISEGIKFVFPSSKLVVITQAELGATIRFDGEVMYVPTTPIPDDEVMDEAGAGDAYTGTLLALLTQNPQDTWTEDDLRNAIQVANYAASLIIQDMHSQLTHEMGQKVLSYQRRLGEP